MTYKPGIKAIADHLAGLIGGKELLVAALAAILGTGALLAAPAQAQQFEANANSPQFIGQRRPPSQTAINDCSRWAMTATGFNPGSTKLPPAWGQPKPSSKSRQAAYNRWVGACLGQRESAN